MKNILINLFAFSFLLFAATESKSQTTLHNPDLIELLGQSNAEGTALTSELPFGFPYTASPVPNAYIYTPFTNSWQQLQVDVNNMTNGASGRFGIEMILMNNLQAFYGRRQNIIKYAVGGTGLAQQTGGDPDWSPASTGELYDLSNTIHTNALTALGDNRPPKAVIWIQGENDANVTSADLYEANLTDFIAQKRAAYGANVNFIIVSLSDNQTFLTSAYRNIVKAAQASVVQNVTGCFLIETDDLVMSGDALHYNSGALVEIANRIYNTLLSLDVNLPLDLLSFNASLKDGNVSTLWTTENEENVSHFEIEKSRTGELFHLVGKVPAKNIPFINTYSFTDINVAEGLLFYRLKIIDIDGSFEYSHIAIIRVPGEAGNSSAVYPNPANAKINVRYQKISKNGLIELFTIEGKKLMQVNLTAGSNQSTLDLSSLAANNYVLRVTANNETSIIKIVKN